MKRFTILSILLISLFLFSSLVSGQEIEPIEDPFIEPLEEPPVPLVEPVEDIFVEPTVEVLPEMPEQEIDVPIEEVAPAVPDVLEEDLPPLPEVFEAEGEILPETEEVEGASATILLTALIFFAVLVAFFIFWLLMLIDCAKRKFATDGQKTVWIVIIVLIQFLIPVGAIIYYFAVKRRARK
jgi:hypothetical protein